MCTIEHNPDIELPKEDKIIAYKIFGKARERDMPWNFTLSNKFE